MIEGRGGADQGHGGIVTPLVNPAATAAAILRIMDDPALRRDMGDTMRERVKRDYDHPTIIGAYRALYGELAEAPSSPAGEVAGRRLTEGCPGRSGYPFRR